MNAWGAYLLLAMVIVMVAIALVLGGAEARVRYETARDRALPGQHMWRGLMWLCFGVTVAIAVVGFYPFVTG